MRGLRGSRGYIGSGLSCHNMEHTVNHMVSHCSYAPEQPPRYCLGRESM